MKLIQNFVVTILLISISILSGFISKIKADNVGVGIGTGKIEYNDIIKAGQTVKLPAITVINTGDVTTDYVFQISYHEGQTGRKPEAEWFEFTPNKFTLEAGKSQVVAIDLNIPTSALNGEYFVYLEAAVDNKASTNGQSTVGVAAASKLYFEVENEGTISSNLRKVEQIYKENNTLFKIIGGIIGFVFIIIVLRKVFGIKITRDK
jgi:hypothetical protein